jgi:DNA polymerase-3 subunit chi
MTRINFYVLKAGSGQSRPTFACRLAEKAFGQGLRIYIHTDNAGETARLDGLLWTFRDGSFLPHLVADDVERSDPDHLTPILVGHGEMPGADDGLLINLSASVPGFFSRFQRVAEIVSDDATDREHARERFRFYRDRGYELETHTL